MLNKLLQWANQLKAEAVTLWFCYRHPQTPLIAKILAISIVAYAFSPIDLIPDFIPVLGLLDELVLIPLGVALVVWLTPRPLWEALLREAESSSDALPRLWWGALGVLLLWVMMLGGLAWWLTAA